MEDVRVDANIRRASILHCWYEVGKQLDAKDSTAKGCGSMSGSPVIGPEATEQFVQG